MVVKKDAIESNLFSRIYSVYINKKKINALSPIVKLV